MDSQKKLIIGGLAGLIILIAIGTVLMRGTPEPQIKPGEPVNAPSEGKKDVITITEDTVVEDFVEIKDDPELTSKLKSPIPTPIPETPVPPTPSDGVNNSVANAMNYDTSGIDSSEKTGSGSGSMLPKRPSMRMDVARLGGGDGRVRRSNNRSSITRETPVPPTPSGPTPTPDPEATPTPEPTPTPTPIEGSALMYLEPSQVTIAPGEIAKLDLYIQAFEQPVGGYTTLVLYNPLDVQLEQLLQGRDPYLGYPLVADPTKVGSITLSSAQATVFDRPIGIIHLMTITFIGTELGEHFIELAESEVANVHAQRMFLHGQRGATIKVQEPEETPTEDAIEDDTPQ